MGPQGAQEARQILRDAGFSDEEMKEVAFVVGVTDFLNRLNTIPAIPAHTLERIPEQLHMRLLRPLIKRIVERKRFGGERHRWNGRQLIRMQVW